MAPGDARSVRSGRLLRWTCLLLVVGQSPPLGAQVLTLRHYDATDGLVSNAVRCITEDSFGYLWIGTTEGISIFDGVAFRNLSILDGLSNSNINWLEESRRSPGTMWVGTNGGGVCRVSPDSIGVILLPGDQRANRVNQVLEDASGRVWCATDGGIFVISGDGIESFRPELRLQDVVAVPGAGGETTCAVTSAEILVIRGGSGVVARVPVTRRPDEIFTCAGVIPGGGLWVGSSAGRLVRIQDGAVAREVSLGAGYSLTSIHIDRDGLLRVGSYDGIFTLDPAGEGMFRTSREEGLQENGITVIYGDRESNLWFGGFTSGLSLYRDTPVLRFPIGPTLQTANDAGIVVDRKGGAWVLAPGGLMEIRKERSGAWVSSMHSLAGVGEGNRPRELLHDATRNGLWIALADNTVHFYGIAPRSGGPSILTRRKILEPGRDFPRGSILRIAGAADGSLTIALFGTGLCIVNPWTPGAPAMLVPEAEHGVPGSDIRAALRDRSGSLWLGGYLSGVVKLDPAGGSWRVTKKHTSEGLLTDNSVRVLFEDQRGRIWVGTRYGGISVIDGESSIPLTVREGLLSNGVWTIARDSAGTVWVGTQAGLQPIDPGSLSVGPAVADLPRMIVQSCAVDSRRIVWAYGWGEAVLFDAGHPPVVRPPPPIHITRLSADGVDISPVGTGDLGSLRSNLTVEFTGISLSNPEAVRYVYRLEGVDGGWQPPTRSRSLTFAALKPGEYRLLIRALNADGVESVDPAALSFSVLAPVWQRWWFITGMAAVLPGLGYLLYRNRIGRLKAIERVRSRIATDLHDDIGSDLTQIAILSEVVKANPAAVDNAMALEKIGSMARRAIAGMSDLVWYVDPRHDRVADLVDRIRDIASGLLAGGEVSFAVTPSQEILGTMLPPELRKDLLLTVKEALTNAVRHSGCSRIRVDIREERNRLVVVVEDDGRGLPPDQDRAGHGIANMRKRIEGLGGTLEVGTAAPSGMLLRIELPVA